MSAALALSDVVALLTGVPTRPPARRSSPSGVARCLKRALLVFGITLGLYLACDLAVGLVLGTPHPPVPDIPAIPALRNQSYATARFAADSTLNDRLEFVPGEKMYWQPERRGEYFNVGPPPPTPANYRRTTNPPVAARPTRIVLFVGASDVYGPFVPDDQTLPSLLSARLNASDPVHGYIVYNAGVQSTIAVQQLRRLQYELDHGLKPDLVIPFGGGVDVTHGVLEGAPGIPAMGDRGRLSYLLHRYFPANTYRWLRKWLSDRATAAGIRRPPAHLNDPGRMSLLIDETARSYAETLRQMAALSTAHGARFMAILEPNLYTNDYTHEAASPMPTGSPAARTPA
jgi:lysophospholipase L1-like esterase